MLQVQRYFNQVAPKWDHMRQNYFPDRLAKKIMERARVLPDMKVADIGVGTGFVAIALAPYVERVVGIDLSDRMLATAKHNVKAAGITNVDFSVGNAEHLPFDEDVFDVVVTNMMLHHVPNPLAAICDMVRILKPGGRLVISDVDTHNFTWAHEQMADVWLGFGRQDILAWMAEAGLAELEIGWSGCNCQGISPEQQEVVVSVFMACGVKLSEEVKR